MAHKRLLVVLRSGLFSLPLAGVIFALLRTNAPRVSILSVAY